MQTNHDKWHESDADKAKLEQDNKDLANWIKNNGGSANPTGTGGWQKDNGDMITNNCARNPNEAGCKK